MKVRCPNCGALFEAEGEGIAECPYCGFRIKIGEARDFMYPLKIQNPRHFLMSFIRLQSISPNDVDSKARILEQKLYYVPFYLFFVEASGSAHHGYISSEGFGRVEFMNYIAVPAVEGFDELINYPLPAKGRRYFERSEIKGKLLEKTLDVGKARRAVIETVSRSLKKEAERYYHWGGVDVSLETRYAEMEGLVYYPIWRVTYKYGFFTYTAYVDGVDGRIPFAEFPISGVKRFVNLTFSSLLLLTGVFTGKLLMGYGITAPLGAVGTAVIGAYPSLRKSLRVKGRASEHRILNEVKEEIMPEEEAFRFARQLFREI